MSASESVSESESESELDDASLSSVTQIRELSLSDCTWMTSFGRIGRREAVRFTGAGEDFEQWNFA